MKRGAASDRPKTRAGRRASGRPYPPARVAALALPRRPPRAPARAGAGWRSCAFDIQYQSEPLMRYREVFQLGWDLTWREMAWCTAVGLPAFLVAGLAFNALGLQNATNPVVFES